MSDDPKEYIKFTNISDNEGNIMYLYPWLLDDQPDSPWTRSMLLSRGFLDKLEQRARDQLSFYLRSTDPRLYAWMIKWSAR